MKKIENINKKEKKADELEIRPEFIKKLMKIKKEKNCKRFKTISELRKLIEGDNYEN